MSNAEVSVPQSGIFALGTSSHAYLEFVPALSALRAFATAE